MKAVLERPLFTASYSDTSAFQLEEGSAYIYARSSEDRSQHNDEWRRRQKNVLFAAVFEQTRDAIRIKWGDLERQVQLRSLRSTGELLATLGSGALYLDITGLDHSSWAAIVRAALHLGRNLRVVYVEPLEYHYNPTPTEGEIFDLSERITGIAPLPGYASLRALDGDFVFVPLLGFEGARLSYLLEHVQPKLDAIVPVVGVPGFRPEYPFHTYWGNKTPLLDSRAFRRAVFARANCPFAAFYVLTDIADMYPGVPMRLAPIGTKPHALGAVLFFLVRSKSGTAIELVYDHPIRKAGRTEGAGRVCVYYVSSFIPGGP